MMKRFFYRISTILQVLLLIAAFAIQKFSVTRMGMMRYVVFMNQQWEAQYSIKTLRYVVTASLGILSISIMLYTFKKKWRNTIDKKMLAMSMTTVVLALVSVFFILAYSTESYRSYYFMSMIFTIVVWIQALKAIVHFRK